MRTVDVCGEWWCWAAVSVMDRVSELELLAHFGYGVVETEGSIEVPEQYDLFVVDSTLFDEPFQVCNEVFSNVLGILSAFFAEEIVLLRYYCHRPIMAGMSLAGLIGADECDFLSGFSI